ncbi:hypothetical protein GW17_00011892 [Ensete ventricosum]|nr:hypothetical protein GW17_00011892 [Ensete ventricosum]
MRSECSEPIEGVRVTLLLLSQALGQFEMEGELGAVLFFIHGFPEIWYSWRHQMHAVAKAGFKAITPDLRGYGLSTQPSESEKTTWEDLVADLLAILNFLCIPKVPFWLKQ